MNKENTNKLWDTFPDLYADSDKPPSESNVIFGFECDNGWFPLIWDLSEKLTELIKNGNSPNLKAFQIKEKFGTLRYYVGGGSDEVYDLIAEAEKKSATICEVCGNKGKTRGLSWLKTLCGKCAKEQGYPYNKTEG